MGAVLAPVGVVKEVAYLRSIRSSRRRQFAFEEGLASTANPAGHFPLIRRVHHRQRRTMPRAEQTLRPRDDFVEPKR